MEEQECGGEAGVLPHQGLYCYTACVWEMSAKLSYVQDFVNQLSFFGDIHSSWFTMMSIIGLCSCYPHDFSHIFFFTVFSVLFIYIEFLVFRE